MVEKQETGEKIPKKRKYRHKRGPKRKRKYYYISRKKRREMEEKELNKKRVSFKILKCHNRKQQLYIGRYYTLQEAYEAFNKLKEESDEVIFPKAILVTMDNTLKDNNDEYILLEKNRDGTKVNLSLRNEYGKLVPHNVTSDKWVIIDKIPALSEETFWVYGFDPRTDRKDFKWIYDNLINIRLSKYDALRVILYKNKIVIKNDLEEMNIIFCKTINESIKLYNLLEEWVNKNKVKQVYFLGSFNKISNRKRALEKELVEYTGWDKYKIQMSSTRKVK